MAVDIQDHLIDNRAKMDLGKKSEGQGGLGVLVEYLLRIAVKSSSYVFPCLPRRYLVCFFLCTGLLLCLMMRTNLSVALVAMVTSTTKEVITNGTTRTIVVKEADFNWDLKLQGLILGAFFYSYTPATVPCGYLGARFGGYRLYGLGNLLVAILTFFIPIAARINAYALIAVRFLQGPCQALVATTYPAIISLWVPPNERCKVTAIVVAGYTAGIVCGTMVSGVIAEHVSWSFVFYISGILSLLWCFAYFWLMFPCPENDPNISKEEKEHIQKSFSENGEDDRHSKAKNVPWVKIVTSLPFLAACTNIMCHSWGIFTLINGLPMYFKHVLKFDIEKSGVMTSLPFAAQMVVGPLTGKIVDSLTENKVLSSTNIRKFCCCVGFAIEAAFFLLIAHYNKWQAILPSLIIAFFLGGISSNPIAVNHIDLAPRYASLLLGILNGISCTMGIFSPMVMSFLTPNQTEAEWRTLFILTASIYGFGILIYSLFGSAEKQSWADGSPEKDYYERIARSLLDETPGTPV